MKTKQMFMLSAALLFAVASSAQTATPKVTKRQVNQQVRIKEGKESGELTKKEARQLQLREAKIQHDKKEAKSDGVVTPEEKAKLNREQKRASRAIYRKKHNEVKK